MKRLTVHVIALAAALPNATPAWALPDLTPEIFDVSVDENGSVDPGDVIEGCAGAATGRRLVHFSLRTLSLGPDDLVMGDPQCPDCSSNPGAPCGNPLFVCSEAHGHPHFEGFVEAELLDANQQVVAVGRKQGFCLLDLECADPVYHCGFQGISAGCADVYAAGLPCQYIDITDAVVPDGDYTLRTTVDPDGVIAEADEANNTASVPLFIGEPPPPPPTTCPVVTAEGLPIALPDLAITTSALQNTRAGTIESVRVVALRATHTFVGDLELRLRSPDATEVIVADHVCGSDDDFALDLSDAALTAIPCPPTSGGMHLPSNALAAFAGKEAAGTWTLEVDDTAGGDDGELQGWGLEICTKCGNGVLDAGEVCDDGNAADADCCSSDCQTSAADGTACDDASQCIMGGQCTGGTCTGGTTGCDPCLVCDPPLGCVPPSAVLCDSAPAPVRSAVAIKRGDVPAKDTLRWKYTSGGPIALLDFGSPAAVTDLTMCVLDDDGLKLSATATAAGTCNGKPCWKVGDDTIKYADSGLERGGIAAMTLKAGDAGKARLVVKGKGDELGLGTLPLSGDVVVRLKRSGGPACWQAEFSVARRTDGERYDAKLP